MKHYFFELGGGAVGNFQNKIPAQPKLLGKELCRGAMAKTLSKCLILKKILAQATLPTQRHHAQPNGEKKNS